MAFNKGKGNILAAEISSVYTAIPQIISISKTGEGSETYSARSIDGNKHDVQPNNGFVSNPEIKCELWWDSNNTVHVFLKTSERTPPTAGVNFKHTDTGGTPVVEIWLCYGIKVEEKITTNEGIKADVTLTTSGSPS